MKGSLAFLLVVAGYSAVDITNACISQREAQKLCGFTNAPTDQVLIQRRKTSHSGFALQNINAKHYRMASCCAKCSGRPFCSPKSQTCYSTKAKTYYESCPIMPCEGSNCPLGMWSPTSATSGTGHWCEIGKAPDAWTPLKSCPTSFGSSTVKILTYNLFWWNLFERRGGENGRAGRKIATTSGPDAYDFMGFQECKDIDRVLRDAKKHGLSGDYDTLSLVKDDRALGFAYLKTRWTLIASGWEDVGEDSRQMYYGRRAAQWARLQRKDANTTAFFINHHGPLPISVSGGCAGSATAYNILRVIAQNAHANDLVILVGDFNAQHHSSRIQTLGKHMHKVFSGTTHGGVDHIFSNCGEASATVRATNIGTGGSDHDALSAVFKSMPYEGKS